MAFLNATSQFRKIVGKMVSYFEDEFKFNGHWLSEIRAWDLPLTERKTPSPTR